MKKNLLIALIVASAVLIFWAGLSPTRALPALLKGTAPTDLILHALAFGALALPAALLLGPFIGGAVTSIAVVALELLQKWAPGREPSISDIGAGLAGTIAVVICVWFLGRARAGSA